MNEANDQTPRLCQCSDAMRYEDVNKHEPGCPRLNEPESSANAIDLAADSAPEVKP